MEVWEFGQDMLLRLLISSKLRVYPLDSVHGGKTINSGKSPGELGSSQHDLQCCEKYLCYSAVIG